MAQELYKVSVPGSLMLLGEHAVLSRKQAIVCAVDKRLNITLTPDDSQTVKIFDTRLGTMQQDLADLKVAEPFQFVLGAIILFKKHIKRGFNLQIDADFSSKLGMGSSAAVTVATVAVLTRWIFAKQMSPKRIFNYAKQVMLQVQGFGSGADLAASVYGGVLRYQVKPFKCHKLPLVPNLTAVYSGSKKPTKEVLEIVKQKQALQPNVYASIYSAMQMCVKQASIAIKRGDWPALGQVFKHHHGLQNALGVSNGHLENLIDQLNQQPEILGAKISGAGLGDCIIGLGALPSEVFPQNQQQQEQGIRQIAISIDQQGLQYANN